MITLNFMDHRLMLDPLGAVVWPSVRMLAVADLHLEKGTACAAQGRLVPPLDTRLTLDRLARLMRRHRPQTVIALGDTFQDRDGYERMDPADSALLADMASATRFVWVLGNHDPLPTSLPGLAVSTWNSAGLTFRHEARPGAEGEICGHHHPKATIQTRVSSVTRPCFVFDRTRLMLPALGAYTGGLDVRNAAIARLYPAGAEVALLGRDRLFRFAFEPYPQNKT